jgi:Lar family restriction alleviation protein
MKPIPIVFDEFIGEPVEVPQTHSIAREEHPMTSPTLDAAERAELLPCPFCGEEAEISEYTALGAGITTCTVTCVECGAATDIFLAEEKGQAIAAWNRRAALSAPQESGWQAIDTAPKDGTEIDVWAEPNAIYRKLNFLPCRMPHVRWMTRYERWSGMAEGYVPTHWRPLPPPPGEQQENNHAR